MHDVAKDRSLYVHHIERQKNERLSLLHLIEQEVRHLAVEQHSRFQNEVWGQRASFHNERHIVGVYQSVDALFRTLRADAKDLQWLPDYLNPYIQLQRYNEMITLKYAHLADPSQYIIQPEELEGLLKITFLMHDTGNTQMLTPGGPVDFDIYRGIGAEERSMENLAHYLSPLPLDKQERARYQEFINYITAQTKFIFDGSQVHAANKPFGVFTRFVDVIGQGLFNQNQLMEQVVGLIIEQATEDAVTKKKPDPLFTPANTLEFLWTYAQQLVPEDNGRHIEIIERLLGLTFPEKPVLQPHTKKLMKRSTWVSITKQIPYYRIKHFLCYADEQDPFVQQLLAAVRSDQTPSPQSSVVV